MRRRKWQNTLLTPSPCIECSDGRVVEDAYERFINQQYESLPIYVCLACGAEWGPGIDAADDDQQDLEMS